jgi:flagellar hook-associated protein 2
MTTPIGTVQGLASGIQWQTMVQQIVAADSSRELGPVTAQQTTDTNANAAWKQFQTVMGTFQTASAALADPAAFDLFTATAPDSASSQRALLSATAATGAQAGTYAMQVLSLAAAESQSGASFSSSTSPLNVSGQFDLNGVAITVASTDSLSSIADKINAADAGTTPSGVRATILSGTDGSHLVLTSDLSGAQGISAVDDANGTFKALGFTDGTAVANISASGATQTFAASSATQSIGSLLSLTPPAATSILVGGKSIALDLGTDTLTTIAAKINAATGNPSSASVRTQTVGSATTYQLVTDSTVEVDPGANAADSARALAMLGFTKAGTSGIAQVVQSANSFTDATTNASATSATLLSNLQVNGQSLGLGVGDKVNIGGTRGDGSTVTRTLTVGASTTVQDLLNAINDSTSGFGATSRTALASLNGGKIAITDGTSGDSQLSLSLSATRSGGGTVSLGSFGIGNGGSAGRSREVTAGADAQFKVDGQTLTRSTNTVSDAIAGVTLNLLSAEPGTTVNLTIALNSAGIESKINNFVTAYNGVQSFITQNTANGSASSTLSSTSAQTSIAGPLANDMSITSMGYSITTALIQSVTGLSGSYTAAAQAGLMTDANGVLSLNKTTFETALQNNLTAVKNLFVTSGTASDSRLSFVSAGTTTQPSATPYAVNITQAATTAAVTGSSFTTYSTTGTPDTMSIADAATGKSTSITMANGDSIDTIVQRINDSFSSQGMRLQAVKTAGSQVQIVANDFGSTGGFTVSYSLGSGGSGVAALAIAAQSYSGLNVAGTINGTAAAGRGQYLTGSSGDASAGLIVRYTGTTSGSAGTVALSLGVGGLMNQIATGLNAANTGAIALEVNQTQTSADNLQSQIGNIQQQLAAEQTSLTAEFVAMESAMSSAQAVGATLTGQINGLSAAGL